MATGGDNLHFEMPRNPRWDYWIEHTGKKIIPTLRIHIGFWIRQQFQDWRLKKKCVCGNVEINQYISSNIFSSRIAVFFSP